MNHPATLIVVFTLVIAGCSGASTEGPTPTSNTSFSPTETPTTPADTTVEPPTVTETPTPTETETPKRANNPWAEEPIIVAIHSPSNSRVNYTGAVIHAVKYWQASNYPDLQYRPDFVVRPSETRAHVLIRFAISTDACGQVATNETIGCAPRLDADDSAATPEIVRVQQGLTNRSTYRVVRHELGHVLGLKHGEGPENVMSPSDVVHDRVVRVNFEFETTATAEQRETRQQARYAFDYYSDGAVGFMDEDVSFAIIDSEENADITISVERDGDQSITEVQDGQVVFKIQGIDINKRGWHIGYWLGVHFGAESVDDLPPAFDEPNVDPRQQWW